MRHKIKKEREKKKGEKEKKIKNVFRMFYETSCRYQYAALPNPGAARSRSPSPFQSAAAPPPGGARSLVERFDIESYSDFSAK